MIVVVMWMMWWVLLVNGISVFEVCLLVLFVGLFVWIVFLFVSVLVGFLIVVFDWGYWFGIDLDKLLLVVYSCIVLLMLIYNEDLCCLLVGL